MLRKIPNGRHIFIDKHNRIASLFFPTTIFVTWLAQFRQENISIVLKINSSVYGRTINSKVKKIIVVCIENGPPDVINIYIIYPGFSGNNMLGNNETQNWGMQFLLGKKTIILAFISHNAANFIITYYYLGIKTVTKRY